jgi:hypothetical protein
MRQNQSHVYICIVVRFKVNTNADKENSRGPTHIAENGVER